MQKLKLKYVFIFFIAFACNDDNEFSSENLNNVLSLSVENNNALSDGNEEIIVVAEFPIDFNTETDGMVDFEVFKDVTEVSNQNIELIQEGTIQKRQASVAIKHNKVDSLRVKATISINNILISETIYVNFTKAYLNSINITSSSLTISPNSFNEIDITTQLSRNTGNVSLNSIAETVVVDSLGQEIGLFNNYKNKTDLSGNILNKYTLGNDDYQGRLHIISTSTNINNQIISDTLTIYSQN